MADEHDLAGSSSGSTGSGAGEPSDSAGGAVRPAPSLAVRLGAARVAAKAAAVLVRELAFLGARRPFSRDPLALKARTTQAWCRATAAALNLRVHYEGQLPGEGCLIVANHRSYTDIPAVGAAVPCVFLSKTDVGRYPLLGPAAQAVGTVFVEREEAGSRAAALRSIERLLAAGVSVVAFPEGTTTAPPMLRSFHPGLFRMAASSGFRVVPVAVAYADAEDTWCDEPMGAHFVRRYGKRQVPADVTVTFGPPLSVGAAAEQKREAEEWIAATLASHR